MANGQSDPNISLSRNVLDPKRSSRIKARYRFARDVRESDNVLKSSVQQAEEQNEKAADSSFWGRLGGMGLGTIAGLALAPLTGGASLGLMSTLQAATLGAGLGSYLGSKGGESLAGGIETNVESGGFGLDKVSDIEDSLDSYEKGVNQDRLMNAATDAFSVYTAGGGLSPGSGFSGGTKYFASDVVGKQIAKSAAEQAGHSMLRAQAQQLVLGGAENYAKKEGMGYLFDNAYEKYVEGT